MVKLGKYAKILRLMYKDSLDVYYYPKVKKENGTTGYSDVPVYKVQNAQCKVSTSKDDTSETVNFDRNPVEKQTKVFCDVTLNVEKGDMIIARVLSDEGEVLATYQGLANKPDVFVTHQEIIIDVKDGLNASKI